MDDTPKRFSHVFQKQSGSREMVEDPDGDWMLVADCDELLILEARRHRVAGFEAARQHALQIVATQVARFSIPGIGQEITNALQAMQDSRPQEETKT